jgi:hypothetical protein
MMIRIGTGTGRTIFVWKNRNGHISLREVVDRAIPGTRVHGDIINVRAPVVAVNITMPANTHAEVKLVEILGAP